jgi:leucyl-tRNA synthetase
MILAEDNRKMSKSLGNVINPDDVVREYGADALRLYEMFMAPFSQEITWSTRTLQGTYRFLKRIYNLSVAYENYENEVDYTIGEYSMLSNKLAQTIQKVAGDIVEIKFNTAVASMMEFLNLWEEVAKKNKFALSKDDLSSFLRILSPFAPFMTEEIWRNVLKNKVSIHSGDWPIVESSKLQKQEIVLPIQINGKMRSTINVTVPSTQEEIQIKALTDPVVKKHIGERKIIKTIYVPSKIINFIV